MDAQGSYDDNYEDTKFAMDFHNNDQPPVKYSEKTVPEKVKIMTKRYELALRRIKEYAGDDEGELKSREGDYMRASQELRRLKELSKKGVAMESVITEEVDQATKDKIANMSPEIIASLAKKYQNNPDDQADVGKMVSELIDDPDIVNKASSEGLDIKDTHTQAAIMDHIVDTSNESDDDMVGDIATIATVNEKTNTQVIVGMAVTEAFKIINIMEKIEGQGPISSEDGSLESRLADMESKLSNLQDSVTKMAANDIEAPDENNIPIDISDSSVDDTEDKMDMYSDQIDDQEEYDMHDSDFGNEFDDADFGLGEDAIGNEELNDEYDGLDDLMEESFAESLNSTDVGDQEASESVSKIIGSRYSGK